MKLHVSLRPVIVAFAVLLVALAFGSGFVRVRGWDWTVGTNNTYCYVYAPAHSVGCEHAN
jgi:hypothetical protein